MKVLQLCPVCLRVVEQLVDCALDFTGSVTRDEFPRICPAHLPLVFSSLSHPTMAKWLDHVLERRWTAEGAEGSCPLCRIEADVTIPDSERENAYLCPAHGGPVQETVESIRRNLRRIMRGERFDHEAFIVRAALMFYASIRGTSPMVRIE